MLQHQFRSNWLQCVLSECCWLAPSLLAVCYRLFDSVPTAVEDDLLRLCIAENSVLPLVGEKLRTDHLLLGRRRESNDENWP